MTNFEYIKNMSKEELSFLLDYYMCPPPDPDNDYECLSDCRKCWNRWLTAEHIEYNL